MKVVLGDALHARPANLFVRLASRFQAEVRVSTECTQGPRCVDAKNILDVLSLGAAKGQTLELAATGVDAEAALLALAELAERRFDADLVPEIGKIASAGIAIGHARVLVVSEAPAAVALAPEEAATGCDAAFACAERDLAELLGALAPHEAALFEPEIAILRELGPRIRARVLAGEAPVDAVLAETEPATSDLIHDARARVLAALAGGASVSWPDSEVVAVTALLTPSLVAALPAQVVGIVAAEQTVTTSHAAILARGRGVPLALVAAHIVRQISDGELLVVDTTGEGARIWVTPSEPLLADARARRAALLTPPATSRELPIKLRVNVGSMHDVIPPGVEGIGLVRTELLFAGRRAVPEETEQLAVLLALARRSPGVLTVRLFDAGGDKPLAWLGGETAMRGAALLFAHPEVLDAQLRAISRARDLGVDARVLIPLARSASDVTEVRRRCPGQVPIGAMIETPEAAHLAAEIARVADFLSIGTNDLASLTLGAPRDEDAARQTLDPRVLALVGSVVLAAHARGREVSVCGEAAGDPRAARALVALGVDVLSVAPPKVRVVYAALEPPATEMESR